MRTDEPNWMGRARAAALHDFAGFCRFGRGDKEMTSGRRCLAIALLSGFPGDRFHPAPVVFDLEVGVEND